MNEEELHEYEKQLEIGKILLKNENDVTEEDIKIVNNFLKELEEQNKNSKAYTLEEFENMINEKIEELENEKIQTNNRKNSLAFNRSSF